jgi:hypothetical protein
MCYRCAVPKPKSDLSEAELLNRTQSLLSLLSITPSHSEDAFELMKMEAEFLLESFHEYRKGRID